MDKQDNRFICNSIPPQEKYESYLQNNLSDYEYNKSKVDNQEQIDRILEKISKGGYESLTKEEKSYFLRKVRKKLMPE